MRKDEAIDFFGGQSALARAIDVAQSTVAEWKDPPPLHQQIKIEKKTNGALRADLTDEEREFLARKPPRRRRKTEATA